MSKIIKNMVVAGLILSGSIFSSDVSANSNLAPIVTDSRIKTFVFSESEVYRLVLHYGYQSHIELDKKEEVQAISLGDSYAWKITPIDHRIFLRPLEESAHTNLTIVTDKRVYQFDLQSKEPGEAIEEDLVYAVRFFYPVGNFDMPHLAQAPAFKARPASFAPAAAVQSQPQSFIQQPPRVQLQPMPMPQHTPPPPPPSDVSQGVTHQSKYNFDYTLTGPDPIAPDRVFDDGVKTFFEFPNNNAVVPYVSLVNKENNEVPLNYHKQGSFIVVDVVGGQFALRLGQDVVNVFNEYNNLTTGGQ